MCYSSIVRIRRTENFRENPEIFVSCGETVMIKEMLWHICESFKLKCAIPGFRIKKHWDTMLWLNFFQSMNFQCPVAFWKNMWIYWLKYNKLEIKLKDKYTQNGFNALCNQWKQYFESKNNCYFLLYNVAVHFE